MGYGARRTLRTSLVLIGAVLVALTTGSATAQQSEWRDVEQAVTIQPNGKVVVVDTRTLWTEDDFGEAYICFDLAEWQTIEMLPLTGAVGEGPPAAALSQPCSVGTELVIRNAERVSERHLRFAYALDGTLDVYSDVVQWYWNMIQLNHPPIIGYRLVVKAPSGMPRLFDAFVHRYANPEEGRVWLSDDRSKLVVEFDLIPPGDGVEVRYLMDPSLFESQGSRPGLQELLRDERELIRGG